MSSPLVSLAKVQGTMILLGVALSGLLTTASPAAAQASSRRGPQHGPMTGVWSGAYRYAQEAGLEPVEFTVFLIQEGDLLKGHIKEKNTFGDPSQPWLHADLEGRYDPEERTFRFTKTYDGTAGQIHEVNYQGRLSADQDRAEDGTWSIPDVGNGTFTMRRARRPD